MTCRQEVSPHHLYFLTQTALSSSDVLGKTVSNIAASAKSSLKPIILNPQLRLEYSQEEKKTKVTLDNGDDFKLREFWRRAQSRLKEKCGTVAFQLVFLTKNATIAHVIAVILFLNPSKSSVLLVDSNGGAANRDWEGILRGDVHNLLTKSIRDTLQQRDIIFWKPFGTTRHDWGPQLVVSQGFEAVIKTIFPGIDVTTMMDTDDIGVVEQMLKAKKKADIGPVRAAFTKSKTLARRALLDLLVKDANLKTNARHQVADLLRAWVTGTCQLWVIWFLYLIAVTGVRRPEDFQAVYRNALDIILKGTPHDVQQEAVVLSEYLGRFTMQLGSLHNFTYNRNSGGKGHILLNNQVVINDAGSKSLSLPRKWKTA
jgi:hypothetical protein